MGSNLSGPEGAQNGQSILGRKSHRGKQRHCRCRRPPVFPPESVNKEFLKPSNHTTVCPWKGMPTISMSLSTACRTIMPLGIYPQPKPAAAEIKDRIAFWKGVRVKR